MWVITLFLKKNIIQFEYDTEIEAKEVFKKLKGNKYLTQVI